MYWQNGNIFIKYGHMSAENLLYPEPLKNYNWLMFDLKKGAPFNIAFPIMNQSVISLLEQKEILIPFSRWTVGRKKNPNFSLAGSGLEGHLCALDMMSVKGLLADLQNDAFRMVKQDVGTNMLDKFLADPSYPINLKFLNSMRIAFDTILAKSRAVRSMANKGGYVYTKDGEKIKPDPKRIQRCQSYESFVYSAPLVIDWTILPREKGTLSFDQQIKEDNFPSLPISIESIGDDIGFDPQFKLLAELGRFAHPVVQIIRNSL